MPTQMEAILGNRKRLKPNYVGQINAQKGMLPLIYQQKEQKEQDDKYLDLQERSLDMESDISQRNLKYQRKQDDRANRLGWAQLGVQGAMALPSAVDALKGPAGKFAKVTPQVASGAVDFLAEDAVPWIKKIGSGAASVGKSIYENTIGAAISGIGSLF